MFAVISWWNVSSGEQTTNVLLWKSDHRCVKAKAACSIISLPQFLLIPLITSMKEWIYLLRISDNIWLKWNVKLAENDCSQHNFSSASTGFDRLWCCLPILWHCFLQLCSTSFNLLFRFQRRILHPSERCPPWSCSTWCLLWGWGKPTLCFCISLLL